MVVSCGWTQGVNYDIRIHSLKTSESYIWKERLILMWQKIVAIPFVVENYLFRDQRVGNKFQRECPREFMCHDLGGKGVWEWDMECWIAWSYTQGNKLYVPGYGKVTSYKKYDNENITT